MTNNKDKLNWKDSLARFLDVYPDNRKKLITLLNDLQKFQSLFTTRELQIIQDVLRMREWKIRDVMTHYSDVVTVNTMDSYEAVVEKVCDSEHSRYPVICQQKENTEDDVLGILLAKDILRYSKNPAAFSVTEVMRVATFEPDSKTLDLLLDDFLQSQNHMIIVINEFTKPAGIITVEDLLERIVGEIADESDNEEDKSIVALADNRFRIKGILSLEEFNQEFKAQLKHDEADSVAELIAAVSEKMPEKGECYSIQGFDFVIDIVKNRRIYRVIVTAKENSVD